MTAMLQSQDDIKRFCEECSAGLASMTDNESRIKFVEGTLPDLLRSTQTFGDLLRAMLEGTPYPDLRQATMFDNEMLLHADPDHLYSLRAFLWAPGEYTVVHDHGSWGVIGPVSGKLEVVNYCREDDGSKEDYARLAECERLMLSPGDTTFTLPLNAGIHAIGNPTSEAMLSLSIYGRALPRGYVIGFDVDKCRTYRILAPKMRKQLLALQALTGIDQSAGRAAAERMRKHPLDIVKEVSAGCFVG